MSVTFSGTNNGREEWLSVTEAALLARVSERTIQRWIESGRVVSDMSDDGRRRVRRESLPLSDRPHPAAATVTDRPAGPDRQVSDVTVTMTDSMTDSMTDVVECRTSSPATHALSDIALATARAEALEREIARADAERERLTADMEFLRAQLEQRAEEAARHAEAERELRVMLMHLERTNAELAGALVVKALPAPEIYVEPVKRVRWWNPATWGRG